MISKENIIYISSLTLYSILVAVALFYVSNFFAEKVNNAFILDSERISSSINRIDFDKFRQVAPRLGIDTTDL